MIFEAGDETSSQRLTFLARSLEEECRARLDDVVAQGLVQCSVYLAPRTGVYALLAGLLNLHLPTFGALLSEQVTLGLTRELQAGAFEQAAPLLRLLAELCVVKVIAYNVLASVYTQLMATPTEAIVGFVLRSLPWAGRGLAANEGAALDSVMERVTAFLNRADRVLPVPALCVMNDDSPATENYLLWAQEQIDALRGNDWDAGIVIVSVSEPHAQALEGGHPHALALPEIHVLAEAQTNPLQPQMLFRLFPRQDSEKDLSGDGAERLVLEQYIVEAMRYFAGSLDLVVQRLLAMPVRGGSEYILVETIVGQLLMLPRPELPRAFYHSLIDSLYKAAPRLQALFERALESLFENVEHLDVECRERVVEWMAVYLSNTQFKWEWNEWKQVLTLSPEHAKVMFVRSVLGRCVRLSYWARIEGTLPSPDWVQPLMPPPPTPAIECDPALLAIVKAGQKPQGAITLAALLPALLARGETFSLLKLALRQYGGMLRKLTVSDEAKLSVLQIVGAYWADSEGHRLMVIDLLMSVIIVDHVSIVSWVFSEESASLLSDSPWEILHMAFFKTVERTAFLRTGQDAEKLEKQLREEKDLFLTTFQRFVIVMESYLVSLEGTADATPNHWFQTVLAQMIAFLRRYRESIQPFISTLQSVVFSDTDPRIRDAFMTNFATNLE